MAGSFIEYIERIVQSKNIVTQRCGWLISRVFRVPVAKIPAASLRIFERCHTIVGSHWRTRYQGSVHTLQLA